MCLPYMCWKRRTNDPTDRCLKLAADPVRHVIDGRLLLHLFTDWEQACLRAPNQATAACTSTGRSPLHDAF